MQYTMLMVETKKNINYGSYFLPPFHLHLTHNQAWLKVVQTRIRYTRIEHIWCTSPMPTNWTTQPMPTTRILAHINVSPIVQMLRSSLEIIAMGATTKVVTRIKSIITSLDLYPNATKDDKKITSFVKPITLSHLFVYRPYCNYPWDLFMC